jgi:hypothetical protein
LIRDRENTFEDLEATTNRGGTIQDEELVESVGETDFEEIYNRFDELFE